MGISLSSTAQLRELRGMVKVNNSETNAGTSEYVEGAVIRYVSQRQVLFHSEKTGTDGKFILAISGVTGNPQIPLDVVFDKKNEDYYVVNEEAISDITLMRDAPIDILVFSKKEATRLKQQAIEERLQPWKEKIAAMQNRFNNEEQANAILRDSIINMLNEMDELRKILNNTLDYWLRLDLDKGDKEYKQAYKLAMEGKFEESNGLIPKDEDIIQDINAKLLQIRKATRLRIENFKALGYTDSVKAEYELIIKNPRDNDEVMQARRELVDYLRQIGDYSEANKVNEDRSKSNSEKKTEIMIDEINRLNAQYDIDKSKSQDAVKNAYKNLIKAIGIYKDLKKGLDENIPKADKEAAISYTLLANYYKNKKQYPNAERNYLKALDVYIGLNKTGEYDPVNQTYMLSDLASIYVKQGNDILVKQCEDRIKILSKLPEMQNISESESAKIDEKRGDFALVSSDFHEAINKYEKALKYYLEEDNKNPNLYDFEIAKLYFSLGMANKEKSINFKLALERVNKITSKTNKDCQLEGFTKAALGKTIRNEEYLEEAKEIADRLNDTRLKKYIKETDKNAPGKKFTGKVLKWAPWVLPLLFPLM